jgi:hypothetical protein
MHAGAAIHERAPAFAATQATVFGPAIFLHRVAASQQNNF